MFRHLTRPVLQITRKGVRPSSSGTSALPEQLRKPAHFDELPVPQGCWKEAYNKNQRKYNAQLAFGVTFLVATIAFGRITDLLWLNFSAPTPKE
ncbi:cytochrome c oxidase subunit 7B [Nomia melanderi]|uniref:cytochrome c oxidase subunit 7B n=1 Tax=Nomia melanderi TaxID=2448451 RepID=UPI0013041EB4|nr:uncharacterized protein LOC116431993 [Nomia melanderi]